MLQRSNFAKGYIFHDGRENFIRVEESYDGKVLEFVVGNDEFECGCSEDCECEAKTEFRVNLNPEQVRELVFVIKQLHFIDKE